MKNETKLKKYVCTECFCLIQIKVLKLEKDSEHTNIEYCPFCSNYIESDDLDDFIDDSPVLNKFDDYDEFDEEKYYDDDLDD